MCSYVCMYIYVGNNTLHWVSGKEMVAVWGENCSLLKTFTINHRYDRQVGPKNNVASSQWYFTKGKVITLSSRRKKKCIPPASRRRNSHVLVYHGPKQIATFWEWLAIYHYGVRFLLVPLQCFHRPSYTHNPKNSKWHESHPKYTWTHQVERFTSVPSLRGTEKTPKKPVLSGEMAWCSWKSMDCSLEMMVSQKICRLF